MGLKYDLLRRPGIRSFCSEFRKATTVGPYGRFPFYPFDEVAYIHLYYKREVRIENTNTSLSGIE